MTGGGAALACALVLACAGPCVWAPRALAASESAVSLATPAGGQPAGEVLGAVVELSGAAQACDVDLLMAGASTRAISVALVDAAPAAQRQALAHALGCWWVRAPRDAGIIYTRSPLLPQGTLSVRWTTSGLRDRRELEAPVRALMAPWLGGDAGLTYQSADGVWPATLDAAGHARLVELLTLLERPAPRCPDLLPDPDSLDLERALGAPVRGGSWGELARGLSAQAHVSIALGPGLAAGASAPASLQPGTLREAIATIERAGVHAAVRHGVLCLDAAAIEEREHPAARRRLALLPIGHLLRSSVDGEMVALTLTRAVAPTWWTQPGAGLRFLPEASALLLAADPEVAHQVLDALDRLDQLGLEQGLASLAPAAKP